MATSAEKLAQLRAHMQEKGLAAYFLPHNDPHNVLPT
jgi:hypothetical protein